MPAFPRLTIRDTQDPVDLVEHYELEDETNYAVQVGGGALALSPTTDAPADIAARETAGRITVYQTGTWFAGGTNNPDRVIITPRQGDPIWAWVVSGDFVTVNVVESI